LQTDPANAAYKNNLAWILATWPRMSLRNGEQAVELAKEADQLTGGKDPSVLRTLAAAYAQAGRFPEAVEAAQRALLLVEAQSNKKLAKALQSEIKFYQSGKPYPAPVRGQ
jgi:tetratricopeptide (TPR) repeat protein